MALLVGPVASAHALALERALQIQSDVDDLHCILCEFTERDCSVIIRSLRGSVPQSLRFAVSDWAGQARLESYLRRLRLEAIEVFDPQSLPEGVLGILFGLGTPLRVAFGDLRWICSSNSRPRKGVFQGRRPRRMRSMRQLAANGAVATVRGREIQGKPDCGRSCRGLRISFRWIGWPPPFPRRI